MYTELLKDLNNQFNAVKDSSICELEFFVKNLTNVAFSKRVFRPSGAGLKTSAEFMQYSVKLAEYEETVIENKKLSKEIDNLRALAIKHWEERLKKERMTSHQKYFTAMLNKVRSDIDSYDLVDIREKFEEIDEFVTLIMGI